jgi:hypothetical protein
LYKYSKLLADDGQKRGKSKHFLNAKISSKDWEEHINNFATKVPASKRRFLRKRGKIYEMKTFTMAYFVERQ